MRASQLFTRTNKDASREDVSRNAQLLTRAGYIDRLMAGVYSYLPLGLRVLNRIEDIIREEMNRIGAQEVLLPALQPREIWERTGRWDKVDVLFKLQGQGDRDLALGPTHEEVVTPLVGNFIQSYRDLPTAVYQIQTKFRNEPRAKSGLLRGREFRMKDMYSFHADAADLDAFYERATQAYRRVYERCGLGPTTLLTYAAGGIFSKYSHEFQTITPYGEDIVYRLPGTDLAINKEIMSDLSVLSDLLPNYRPGDEAGFEELKAIEVGNIFKLGTRFSDAFEVQFNDASGGRKPVCMGCYGLGPSRVLGTIAETLSDEHGLVWPAEIAPFRVHLVSLARQQAEIDQCDAIYADLVALGVEVFYDDRPGLPAGRKFMDADLMGIPLRLVVSKNSLAQNGVEWKERRSTDTMVLPLEELRARLAPKGSRG
ncbi:MAG TPA: aminoacyl--tRNA ligase-related protein [Xanthobacteraceae bacterium]